MNLPIIRSHERMDYKRCPTKWYWACRKGYVPVNETFGALALGAWMHDALATWYAPGTFRDGILSNNFSVLAEAAIYGAHQNGAPDHVIEQAEELAALGYIMAQRYEEHYAHDPHIKEVIQAEIPLTFTFSDENGVFAEHRLKPDLLVRDRQDRIWIFEHKTAKTIRTSHLVIDDQARPYGAMAELALKNAGIISKRDHVHGIMYNFLRKAVPDGRPTNAQGKYLNKDGTISKTQPPPYFVRHPVLLTTAAKKQSLRRLQAECALITATTNLLRKESDCWKYLPKTPHMSCPRFCQFFDMCVAHEDGTDITEMARTMFRRRNPYDYGDSTDEIATFEMG